MAWPTFNISDAVYDNVSFSTYAYDREAWGVCFKPDGTKMYISGNYTDSVYQFSLSTAWDISTATYDSKSLGLTQDNAGGITFNNDGTKFFAAGRYINGQIREYTLSTAYDISTATYVRTAAVQAMVKQFQFNGDGTKLYTIAEENVARRINQYALSTAFDLSTLSSVQYKDFSEGSAYQYSGLFISPDGLKLYIADGQGSNVYQYTLSTAWDISTATYVSQTKDISQIYQVGNIFFKPDGAKMYMAGAWSTNARVYQYTTYEEQDTSNFFQLF